MTCHDAASIAVIGAADGPTAIFVANTLGSKYLGAIMVAAYSYMALVPIVQPPVIRLCTTKKERLIRMPYTEGTSPRPRRFCSRSWSRCWPGWSPRASVALVGFLMFGNLLRECGVLNALSETAQNVLANLITIVLGLTVAGADDGGAVPAPRHPADSGAGSGGVHLRHRGRRAVCQAAEPVPARRQEDQPDDRRGGHLGVPDVGRVVNKMGLAEDNQNFLLMHSIGVNVSGQIASVIAGGLILTLMNGYV